MSPSSRARIPAKTVASIAETIGAGVLDDRTAKALASDVEYRLRLVFQDAIKCMRHGKRDTLTAEDVNSALRLRGCEPLYGFGAGGGSVGADVGGFRATREDPEVFYVDEEEIDLKDLLNRRLPRPPAEVSLTPHWLAVEGVQPQIPENPLPVPPEPRPVEAPLGAKRPRPTSRAEDPDGGGLAPVVSHVLSKDLQYYFDKVTGLVRTGSGEGATEEDAALLRTALKSLSEDVGLHNLMPYFTQFITEETTQNLRDLSRLKTLIQMIRALLSNSDINVELYLHQLMPSVVTCVVAKRLCQSVDEDHWSLRDDAAGTIAFICSKFGDAYPSIQPRITRTLLQALLNTKPLPTHYGSIKGLHALGPKVVREVIMPHLREYMDKLEPMLEPPAPVDHDALKSMNEADRNAAVTKAKLAVIRHGDATRVMGALQDAVGACVRDEVGSVEDRAREERLKEQLMRWRRSKDGDKFEKEAEEETKPEPASPSKKRGARGKAASTADKKKDAVVPKAAPLVRSRRGRGAAQEDTEMGDAAAAYAPNVAVSETHI